MKSTTSRGFVTYAEFLDAHDQRVILRESSGDPLDKVWLFVQVGSAGTVPPAALLDTKRALELSHALLDFVADQNQDDEPRSWWYLIRRWCYMAFGPDLKFGKRKR